MINLNKPFRISVKHWDETITIEQETSDVSFNEFMRMMKKLAIAMYDNVELWNNYWEEGP